MLVGRCWLLTGRQDDLRTYITTNNTTKHYYAIKPVPPTPTPIRPIHNPTLENITTAATCNRLLDFYMGTNIKGMVLQIMVICTKNSLH